MSSEADNTAVSEKRRLHNERIAQISRDRADRLNKIKGTYVGNDSNDSLKDEIAKKNAVKGNKKNKSGQHVISGQQKRSQLEDLATLDRNDGEKEETPFDDIGSLLGGEDSLLKNFLGSKTGILPDEKKKKVALSILGIKITHLKKFIFISKFTLITLFALLYIQKVKDTLDLDELYLENESSTFTSVWSKTVREIFIYAYPGYITIKIKDYELVNKCF